MSQEGGQDVAPSGPLVDRLVNKVWKWRLAAYEELTKLFKTAEDGKEKLWTTYGANVILGIVADANAISLETGLDAVLVYIDRADAAPKLAAQLCPILIDKCLNGRPKTKQKGTDALLLYVEIDCGTAVVEALLQKGVNNKVPKIAQASINILTQIIRFYGAKVAPIKPLLAAFPEWFSHRDQGVREEAFAFVTELQRWVGAAVEPGLEKLNPVQSKDLRERFTQSVGPAVPQKFTRSQQAKNFNQPEAVPQAEEPVDVFDLMEEVDILSKLPNDWFDKLQEKKWQLRKEAMKDLLDLLAAPRLKPGDYGGVQRALKKVIASDINVMVVQDAIEAVGKLAAGLRKEFGRDAKELVSVLLPRFKEKKPTLVSALQATMMACARCLNVPDETMEEITEAAGNKVPSVREQLWLWLVEVAKTPRLWNRQFKSMKALGKLLLTAVEDSSPAVRDSACEVLGRLHGIVGPRVLGPYLEQLDETRKKKVTAFFPEAGGAPGPAPVAAPAPVATPAPAPSAPKASTAPKPEPKPTPQPEPKPHGEARKPAPKSAPKGAKAPPKQVEEPLMSAEEAAAKAAELLGPLVGELGSSVWKNRLVAAEQLSELIGQWSPQQCTENCVVVVRQLETKPSLKDSNLQVLGLVLQAIDELAKKVTTFPQSLARSIIPGVVDKLPDAKTKTAGTNLLNTLSLKISPQFVFDEIYEVTKATKNQKVPPATLGWMKSLLETYEFPLQTPNLIAFTKIWLSGSNVPAKNVAVELVILLRLIFGPDLLKLFGDLKPALLDSIQKKIASLSTLSAPARQSLGGASGAAGGQGELPRADISEAVTPLLAALEPKQQWKDKQAAIEEIQRIISTSAKRILPDGLVPLFAALKGRLDDSNQNIIKMSIDLTSELAEALGPEGAAVHHKTILPALLAKFSFNKPVIREAAVRAADIWTQIVGPLQLLPFVGPALVVENSSSRKECLALLVKSLEHVRLKRAEAQPIAKPVLMCLEDKTPEVRHQSEAALKPIMLAIGFETLNKLATSELKPASLRVVLPTLDKIRLACEDDKKGAAPAPAPAPSATPAVPAPAPAPAPTTSSSLFPSDGSATKAARLAEDAKDKKFTFSGGDQRARAEAKKILATALRPFVAGSVVTKMFSPNGAERVEAAHTLTEACRSRKSPEIAGVTDLLFKWIAIQLFEEDAGLEAMFEFLDSLIVFLGTLSCQLTDGESLVLLPYLVEKMSRATPAVCQRIQNDFKLLPQIYPASKVFKFVLEGIKTENPGTVYCLEVLGALINRHGGIMLQPSVLALIAKYLGNAELSGAALNTLANAHTHLQGKLWSSLGNIPPAHLQMLQRHVSGPHVDTAAPVAVPGDKHDSPTKRKIRKCLALLISGPKDEAAYVEALKQACLALEAEPAACLEHATEIVSILTPVFGSALDSSATRLSKYVLATLLQFVTACQQDTLSKESLENLIVEITDRLADKDLAQKPEGKHIAMALNQLVLKVLEKCDYTTCFITLVNSLTREMVQSGPLVELHMKCILKLTKQLPTASFNASLLLHSLSKFLAEVPTPPPRDSMPLKTVKTVLSELVKRHGEGIFTLIDFTPTPLLGSLLDVMLNRNKPVAAKSTEENRPVEQREKVVEPTPVPPMTPQATQEDVEEDVDEVPAPVPTVAPVTPAPVEKPVEVPQPQAQPQPQPQAQPQRVEEPVVAVESKENSVQKINTVDVVNSLRDKLKALNGQDPLSPSLTQTFVAPLVVQAPTPATNLSDLRARLANLKKNLVSN